MKPARAVLLCLLALAASVGCAPREAFYHPAEGRPVGRDGLVGVRSRVPPGAADSAATAVTALSPLIRNEDDSSRASIGAVIELRNKREAVVTFLPESVRLVDPDGVRYRPAAITRSGRAVDEPFEVAHWREAAFTARFELPAELAFMALRWRLEWAYRYEGREYPQSLVFVSDDGELARRSLSGDVGGLVSSSGSGTVTGVPLLMDLPFLGVFFRSSSVSHSRTNTPVVTTGSEGARGEWWPLDSDDSIIK